MSTIVNHFGVTIDPLGSIFKKENRDILAFIKENLSPLYKQHDISFDSDFTIIEENITNIGKIRNNISINSKCKENSAINSRTKIIANQISKCIEKEFKETKIALADIGCGDGMVPYYLLEEGKISVNKPILLTDVIDYRNDLVKSKENDFTFIKTKTEQWSADILRETHNQYDVVLLLTVLHHSQNPSDILSNIPQLLKPNGLLIIIESVIGITNEDASKLKDEEKKLASFTFKKQVLYASFIDWFYNKLLIFNYEVPVPFNYTTHKKWKELVEEYGLTQKSVEMLGFDQKLAPEFHTLHVFKKEI